jgi:hypothetical protein
MVRLFGLFGVAFMPRPLFIRLCFIFSFVLLSPVSVYAEEGQTEEAAAPASCPTCTKCGDAEQGSVETTEGGYCDIYSRQLDYRKHSKAYRETIEKRRVAFEAPRIEALEAFRRNREELYKQESKEYQLELAREAEEAEKALAAKNGAEDTDGAEVMGDKAETMETASVSEEGAPAEETDDAAPAEGVKEKVVEESDGEAKPRKKIIMPEDAPDF